MRPIGRILAALTLVALAGCGGSPDRVSGIPDRFSDIDPYDWRGITPAHHPVHGIDVSRYQGAIDWHRVAGSGVAFAFIKATEGGDYADPMFSTYWHGAARAGVRRGAYHFYYFCRTAVEQAQWFTANVPVERGALPPVLDLEWNHDSRTCRARPDPATVRAEVETFQRIVGARFGQRPLIYTTVDFWRDNELWLLRGEEFWLRSVAGHPSTKYPGQNWTFWQYTGTGVVPGISGKTDLNAFVGSETSWATWLARRQI